MTKLNGIWKTVCANVVSDFQKLLDHECKNLTEMIGRVFEDFHTGFNSTCEEDDTGDPRQMRTLEELNVKNEKAERILKGPMQLAYEALERDFRQIEITPQ